MVAGFRWESLQYKFYKPRVQEARPLKPCLSSREGSCSDRFRGPSRVIQCVQGLKCSNIYYGVYSHFPPGWRYKVFGSGLGCKVVERRSSSVAGSPVPAWPVRYHGHLWHPENSDHGERFGSVSFGHGLGTKYDRRKSVFRLLFMDRTAPVVCSGNQCPWWRVLRGSPWSSPLAACVVRDCTLRSNWSVGLQSSVLRPLILGWMGSGVVAAASSEKEGGKLLNSYKYSLLLRRERYNSYKYGLLGMELTRTSSGHGKLR